MHQMIRTTRYMTSEVSVLKDENTWTESKLNDITNGKHCKATANVSIKRSRRGSLLGRKLDVLQRQFS